MDAEDYLTNHWIKNKVWRNLVSEKHQERFRTICSFLEGQTFIDIGCALGHSTAHLHNYKEGIWSGMEFSRMIARKARKMFPLYPIYYGRNFDLIKSTKGKRFDSVVCSEVIEHVEEDQALFDGLLSLTKKVLVITTPNRKVGDPGHLRIYEANDLLQLFNNNGLKVRSFQVLSRRTFFYMVIRK